jgi:C4-dicarboxylate transporter DctM subunit
VIYWGAATPTEAAAIGFAAALVITAALGTLTWTGFKTQCVREHGDHRRRSC